MGRGREGRGDGSGRSVSVDAGWWTWGLTDLHSACGRLYTQLCTTSNRIL